MKDYKIKIDGKKSQFDGGAIRYNKQKGRMDLVPEGPLRVIVNYLTDWHKAYPDGWNRDFISESTILRELDGIMSFECQNYIFAELIILLNAYKNNITTVNGTQPIKVLLKYIAEMVIELSVHFQKGAEVYGEHNCEKGIPLWSFIDSGKRHTLQFLADVDDGENHYIAAIWNFWMAIWTNIDDRAKRVHMDNIKDTTEPKQDKKTEDNPERDDNSAEELFEALNKKFPKLFSWILERYGIDKSQLSEQQQIMIKVLCVRTWITQLRSVVHDPDVVRLRDIAPIDLIMQLDTTDTLYTIREYLYNEGLIKHK